MSTQTMPVSYCLKDYNVMFCEQYKQMAFYDKSQGKITHVHVLTNGRKLTMNTAENTLTVSEAPEGSYYDTSYVMDSDGNSLGFTESALIVGIGDQRDGGGIVCSYALNNTNCTVILRYESANCVCISTSCNEDCTGPKTGCFSSTSQNDVTVFG